MITIDKNNYLEHINAPWDGEPLGLSAQNIVDFVADTEENANILVDLFDIAYRKTHYSSIRIDSRDILQAKALGRAGYHMTEVVMKVTGVLSKINLDTSQFSKFSFELASPEDYNHITEYSIKYFDHGKFHEDPLISRKAANLRNTNMVKDLTSSYTTHVGRVGSNILGFMILDCNNDSIELLLGGIHPDYRHLSYAFWNRVFYEYKSKGVKKVTTTISAANIPVVNLYSRLGFKFNQSLYGFRKFR